MSYWVPLVYECVCMCTYVYAAQYWITFNLYETRSDVLFLKLLWILFAYFMERTMTDAVLNY